MENRFMNELLLDICKRKIDNGISYEDVLDFIKQKNAEEMFAIIEDRLKEYISKRENSVLSS
jgi:hypothetical protein